MKEKKKKPTYNMWQNTAYFVKAAWDNCPSVLLICLLLAVATAGATVVEMLFVPLWCWARWRGMCPFLSCWPPSGCLPWRCC